MLTAAVLRIKDANNLNQLKLANKNCCSQISADSMRVLKFYTFKQSVTRKHSRQTIKLQDGGRHTAGTSGGSRLEYMLQ